jgi:hypothetical protein
VISRKRMREKNSPMRFWSGVPVRHQRYFTLSAKHARAVIVVRVLRTISQQVTKERESKTYLNTVSLIKNHAVEFDLVYDALLFV